MAVNDLSVYSHETVTIDRDFHLQNDLDVRDRERRSIYPWRGQFSPGLIDLLLKTYAAGGTKVLDPFVGSGTTLFESTRRGVACHGLEVNPAAVQLARMARFCMLDDVTRQGVHSRSLAHLNKMMTTKVPGIDLHGLVAEMLFDTDHSDFVHDFLVTTVMLAMGDGGVLRESDLQRAFSQNWSNVINLPHVQSACEVSLADARNIPLSDSTVDLVITSPPYINVFNYHQNYRKAMELMGWEPLKAAGSEIGSNRKHRGNRFLTVVQYCLDLCEHFKEIQRVLKKDGLAVYVVGRESKVRGIQFSNSQLLYYVAVKATGFRLERWQERKFTNRFGETIYEDLLTLIPGRELPDSSSERAREIGVDALKTASRHANVDILADIQQAIDKNGHVKSSPLLGVEPK